MEAKELIAISVNVLERLFTMNYERIGGSSDQRIIFPNKFPSETKKNIPNEELIKNYTRISEQELRFLFVEEFLKITNYYYSVETPTEFKYKLGENFESITCGEGRSASIDLTIFKRDNEQYTRSLNIEFKNQNSSRFSVGKDILKLIHEKQNGAFIIMLKNTNDGTLINSSETRNGVLDKLNESFTEFEVYWQGDDKSIQLIILSLEQNENKITPVLIHREIKKGDDFNKIFLKSGNGNIESIKGNNWKQYKI